MHSNRISAHPRCCHSKDNKYQVWYKLCPAAKGNPPRGSYFWKRSLNCSLPCVRGEQVHSWQSHGVALTTCELGNAPLFGAFPDRSAVSTARDGGLPKARRRGCKTRHYDGGSNRAPAKILRSKRFVGKGGAGIKALPRRRRGWRSLPCSDVTEGVALL